MIAVVITMAFAIVITASFVFTASADYSSESETFQIKAPQITATGDFAEHAAAR
jgi:hypothetical protein